ncbi:Ubiquitin-conjugating enzyme E2 E2 [Pelomyxa schiedti]|nr:Ubiquitin-conjugating enzyme E2 E2 [Pelomyxa schiedti]
MRGARARMQKELRDFRNEAPANIDIVPNEDDFFQWRATIMGPDNSPYAGGTFYVDIAFPAEYPARAPKLTFVTRVYHPNINKNGGICLDIVKETWSPEVTTVQILLSIVTLLSEPNADHPLVPEIAEVFTADRERYNRTAKEWTDKDLVKGFFHRVYLDCDIERSKPVDWRPPTIVADTVANTTSASSSSSATALWVPLSANTHPFERITSNMHGQSHWIRVACLGLCVMDGILRSSAANYWGKHLPVDTLRECLLYAALFHDCAREGESSERFHGARGESVWRAYSSRKNLDTQTIEIVSQAILFHENHRPCVDNTANVVTASLCNGDRLDRVRLNESVHSDKMYPDSGTWQNH